MSSREWIFRLKDILSSIDKIERYIGTATLSEFKQDELVIDAIIRNFEIIGEAAKAIPPSVRRQHPDVPWGGMSGMRDVLIHEYFGVDLKILWHATKKELPPLKKQLLEILDPS